MAKVDYNALKADVERWLEEDEELYTITLESLQNEMSNIVIALTSKFLHLGSPSGGRNLSH